MGGAEHQGECRYPLFATFCRTPLRFSSSAAQAVLRTTVSALACLFLCLPWSLSCCCRNGALAWPPHPCVIALLGHEEGGRPIQALYPCLHSETNSHGAKWQVEVKLAKAESKHWPALDRGGEQLATGAGAEQAPPPQYAGWVGGVGMQQHFCWRCGMHLALQVQQWTAPPAPSLGALVEQELPLWTALHCFALLCNCCWVGGDTPLSRLAGVFVCRRRVEWGKVEGLHVC